MTQTLTKDANKRGNESSQTKGLTRLLANTYALYLKTQNYHWNVTGPQFHSLHGLFEEQYKELAEAVDGIAERIRTLGAVAPGSFSAFSKELEIKEASGRFSADEMIQQLSQDHKKVADLAKGVIVEAEIEGDVATEDLATQRVASHQKAVWMLESHRDAI